MIPDPNRWHQISDPDPGINPHVWLLLNILVLRRSAAFWCVNCMSVCPSVRRSRCLSVCVSVLCQLLAVSAGLYPLSRTVWNVRRRRERGGEERETERPAVCPVANARQLGSAASPSCAAGSDRYAPIRRNMSELRPAEFMHHFACD